MKARQRLSTAKQLVGGSYENMSFDFLGFTFRPRGAKDRKNNVLFTSVKLSMN